MAKIGKDMKTEMKIATMFSRAAEIRPARGTTIIPAAINRRSEP